MNRLLVKSGVAVTLDPELGDIADCDILIENGRIAQIGSRIEAGAGEVVDATGMIVMPGLVDAHLHTWQTGIRGIAGDWSLFEYGRNMHAGLATQFKADDVYIANLVGALNHIDAGVTTLFDWCHNNPTPAHSDRAIDGLLASGIRAVFGHGTPKPKLDEGGVPTNEQLHPREEVARLKAERLTSDDALVTMAMCIRGPDLASVEACQNDIDLARDFGLLASWHVGGRLPFNRKARDGIHRLAASGHLGPHINSVHSNKLDVSELRLLAEAGASFTTTPEVEMQMGHGFPVTGRILKLGCQPSVGIDVESNIGTDVLRQARFALQLARGFANADINASGKEVDGVAIPSRRALEWATIEGARAMRLDHVIGSLTPGKAADLIFIRTADLNLFPVHNPAEAVLFHSTPQNVDGVMIAGRFLKRGGQLLVEDLAKLRDRLVESGRRILHDHARSMERHA
jgi:cytosine/adenosine deaminase-related metal-dependent hydrolase